MEVMVKNRKSSTREKLLDFKEMEPLAQKATYETLKGYLPPPEEDMKNLTLGISDDDDYGLFELYIAAERPEDAKVLTEARVNRRTGEVEVKVFLPRKPDA